MLSVVLAFITCVKYFFGFSLLCVLLLIGFRLLFEPNSGLCKYKTELHGKVVLITGGNSGIGLETAKNLARRGARVIIASRDKQKSEDAVALIKHITGNDNVEYRILNLANKSNILEFAKKLNEDFDRLDILVNNAGSCIVKRCSIEEGIDFLMQINYLGPFMLTNLLMDKILASKPSRIVNVSSQCHILCRKLDIEVLTECYKSSQAMRYIKTKLCMVLWTKHLAKRLPKGVTVNVIHPGIVKTNIFNKWSALLKNALFISIDLLFRTPLEGAQTIIHLCVSQNLEKSSGGYYEDLREVMPSRVAQDEKLAEELWNKTMFLVNQKN